jgi:hypothetical protein
MAGAEVGTTVPSYARAVIAPLCPTQTPFTTGEKPRRFDPAWPIVRLFERRSTKLARTDKNVQNQTLNLIVLDGHFALVPSRMVGLNGGPEGGARVRYAKRPYPAKSVNWMPVFGLSGSAA